ncbi:hypothetical protein SLEP1_g40275 [Rubroshorea leprosula]|uniref:Uncharacterized protein n=1 Tax=Rubroshorea leprosula TaxID=152421 RepID=A0AAV5L2X1_9ROSI|nr:hypothetical protein SLEP1_g40275 [Rubroshorea leprosula]
MGSIEPELGLTKPSGWVPSNPADLGSTEPNCWVQWKPFAGFSGSYLLGSSNLTNLANLGLMEPNGWVICCK